MSDAWLSQCGEGDAARQSFTFTWQKNRDGSVTITGDSDAVSSDNYIGRSTATQGVILHRKMQQGWWLIELTFSNLLNADTLADVLVAMWRVNSDFAANPWTSFSAVDPYMCPVSVYHAEYPTGDETQTALPYLYPGTALGPCEYIVFELGAVQLTPSAEQPLPTITVTGTFLACPNCPSPI